MKSEKRGFKQLAIDHAEKAVLGLVVLFVLLVVSPMMTVWSRYDKTPEEMAALASESADKVTQSVWPKDEATKYPLTDTIGKSVQELQRPLEVTRFGYSGYGVTFPLYPKQEPIKEPTIFALEDPIADASRALIALRPEGSEYGANSDSPDNPGPFIRGGSPDSGKKKGDSVIPDEFKPRTERRAAVTGGAGVGLQLGGVGAGGGVIDGYDPNPPGAGAAGAGAAGAGAAGVAGTNARGMRFVAVRAVFPLKREIAEFRKALHAATDAEVADLVIVINFEIERQLAVSGTDPWTGPWVKLDIQRAKDVIDEAEDFEQEVVAVGITDPVITMGLLRRVVGEWGRLATHPWVKDYKLSPEERREQERLNERTVEAWKKYLKNQPKPLKRGGFAGQQRDLRGMAAELMQFGQGRYDTVLQNTATDIDPKKLRKRLKDDLKRQTASGRLLLFRYFDFDVEPGRTYRYRIRLELKNPNYDQPVERLQNPDSAKGQTRKSPWSKPTPSTTVPRDTRYFLTRVTPPRGTGEPVASLDVYKWFPVFGTVANSTISARFGGFIAGLKKVWVLRPAQPSFDEERDIPFFSSDMLVDISSGTRLRRPDHPDLHLPRATRGGRGITVGQTLILDSYGRFIWTNPVTATRGRDRAKQLLTWQNAPFEPLKEKAQAGDTGALPLDGDGGVLIDEAGMGLRPKEGRKKRRRSSLRKRRSTGRSGQPGAGAVVR